MNSKLHTENKQLREKITEQASQINKSRANKPNTAEEFSELVDLLGSIKVDVKEVKKHIGNGHLLPNEMSLLDLAVFFKEAFMRGVTDDYVTDEVETFIFFTLCPKLQTYDLVQNEKVAGAKYRRYSVTKKGIQFFAYLEKEKYKKTLMSATPRGEKGAVSKGKEKAVKSSKKRKDMKISRLK